MVIDSILFYNKLEKIHIQLYRGSISLSFSNRSHIQHTQEKIEGVSELVPSKIYNPLFKRSFNRLANIPQYEQIANDCS